ncbi:hypothetical protein [Sulfurospirillum arcachonense]|uniref:hypothetical protein n=1 Tax=Sulfurospirillum arcachonense TaxID=57666 RepID=UPI00046AD47F|nr:hypothetical protein [Sulfurospirillum arcachonense]
MNIFLTVLNSIKGIIIEIDTKKEKKISKILLYFSIFLHMPLLFINSDIILNIHFLKEFADLMASYFVGIDSFALAGKSIGQEYYTIKFIYSYLFISAPCMFLINFYIQANIYLFNLKLIKNTYFNINNIFIKNQGSSAPFFLLIFIALLLIIPIDFYTKVDVDTSIRASFGFFLSTKFGAISIVYGNSMLIGFALSILIIDLLAKVYSKNFRFTFSQKEKNALHKAFGPMLSKIRVKEFVYIGLILLSMIVLFLAKLLN